jgi:hypothetical protein
MSKIAENPFVAKRELKSEVIHFRVAASQKAAWNQALEELGVGDQSAFFRGAIEAAIALSFRSTDPAWKGFVAAIQAEAKKRLGSGLAQEGALGYENAGRETKTISLDALKKSLGR